ncbi:MAG: 4'-phosphopantetheinyl transferase superfamily protein [Bacteroidota bacterium]|nr:4'-phosphopantetheinyl transferase superfamily protein [Bacteroidota bacterium]
MTDIQIIQINQYSRFGLLDISTIEAPGKRELEANGIRLLLNKLFNNEECILAYHASGKPYLKSHSEHISISHSHDKVAICVNEKESTGIDIELIRDKVFTIAHKFLREEERNNLTEADVEKLLVYWAAKETLFKIHGERNINFKEHLCITPFDYNVRGGEIKGEIVLPNYKKNYTLHYQKVGNYILVYPI